MTKTLTIWRHAKAEEKQESMSDHVRRLTEQGKEDAKILGNYLRQKGLPDYILCSPSARTRETLAMFGDPLPPTELQEGIYLASAGELITLLQQVDDANEHVLLVGHNPGLKQLVDSLMMSAENVEDEKVLRLRGHLPTSGMASLRLNMDSWQELAPGIGVLTSYADPDTL